MLIWLYHIGYATIKKERRSFLFLLAAGILSLGVLLSRQEFMKSEPVLRAALDGSQYIFVLTLREDESFEMVNSDFLGFQTIYTGAYRYRDSEIIFLDRPYDNDFIPNTIHVYRDKLILNGDLSDPDTSFARYFDIQLNRLSPEQMN